MSTYPKHIFALRTGSAILLFLSWQQWQETIEAVHIKEFMRVVQNKIVHLGKQPRKTKHFKRTRRTLNPYFAAKTTRI